MTTTEPRTYQPMPVAAPLRVRGRRASRTALSLAIALVVVCGLAVAALVFYARGGHAYLALARPVAYGAQIQPADLVTVQLGADSGLAPIPAAEKDSVMGRYATMPLAAGTLVTRAQLSDASVPGPGHQVVSVTLKADQAPARALAAGTPVLLVRTPDGSTVNGQSSPLSPVSGTVSATRELEYGAGVVVDVVVDAGDGPAVAMAASTGHIAVVVTAGG